MKDRITELFAEYRQGQLDLAELEEAVRNTVLSPELEILLRFTAEPDRINDLIARMQVEPALRLRIANEIHVWLYGQPRKQRR